MDEKREEIQIQNPYALDRVRKRDLSRRPARTLTSPLYQTEAKKEDFDGDEVHEQNPNEVQPAIEARVLGGLPVQIRAQHGAKLNYILVQHGRVGVHYLTQLSTVLSRPRFLEFLQNSGTFLDYYHQPTDNWTNVSTAHLRHVFLYSVCRPPAPAFVLENKYTGWQLLSAQLPYGFCLSSSSRAKAPTWADARNVSPGVVPTDDGRPLVMTSPDGRAHFLGGKLQGDQFADNGFMYLMCQDAGEAIVAHFLHRLERLTNDVTEAEGCTFGVRDVLLPKETHTEIKRIYSKMIAAFADPRLAYTDVQQNDFAEQRAQAVINAAYESVSAVAKKALDAETAHRIGSNGATDLVVSRAKGSTSHVLEMLSSVGQKKAFGQRFLGATSHWRETWGDPRAHGLVTQSYNEGLDMMSFLPCAISSREGIVNTGTMTAIVGYCSSRLIQHMQGITASYLGSARTEHGEMVQAVYGGDEASPDQVERVPLDQMPLSKNATSFALWNEIRRLRVVEYANATKPSQDLFLPFDPKRVWQRTRFIHHFQDAKAEEIWDETQWNKRVELERIVWRRLGLDTGRDHIKFDLVMHATLHDMVQWDVVLRFLGGPPTRLQTNWFFGEIRRRLIVSRVQPNQAIGVLAAQVISHRAMQNALCSKHDRGNSTQQMISAVDKYVNVCKQSAQAPRLMTAFLRRPHDRSATMAAQLAYDLRERRFADFVQSWKVEMPDDDAPAWYYQALRLAPPLVQELFGKYPRMRIDLRTAECVRADLTEFDAATIMIQQLKRHSGVLISGREEDDLDEKNPPSLYVTFDVAERTQYKRAILPELVNGVPSEVAKRRRKEWEDECLRAAVDHVVRRTFEVMVRGIRHIRDAVAVRRRGGDYVVETKGANLRDVARHPLVDTARTTTDYLRDVADVLGIDAADLWLSRMFEDMMQSASEGSAASAHLRLVVSAMTYTGQLVPRTRSGQRMTGRRRQAHKVVVPELYVKKTEATAIVKKAAVSDDDKPEMHDLAHVFQQMFEKTLTNLAEACAYGVTDAAASVTEAVLLGNLAPVGSGAVRVLVNSKDEKKQEKESQLALALVPRRVPCRMMGLAAVQQFLRVDRSGRLIPGAARTKLVSSAGPTCLAKSDLRAWDRAVGRDRDRQEDADREARLRAFERNTAAARRCPAMWSSDLPGAVARDEAERIEREAHERVDAARSQKDDEQKELPPPAIWLWRSCNATTGYITEPVPNQVGYMVL
jgi:DNA-directed RNA polymerase II subunit RPB1